MLEKKRRILKLKEFRQFRSTAINVLQRPEGLRSARDPKTRADSTTGNSPGSLSSPNMISIAMRVRSRSLMGSIHLTCKTGIDAGGVQLLSYLTDQVKYDRLRIDCHALHNLVTRARTIELSDHVPRLKSDQHHPHRPIVDTQISCRFLGYKLLSL
jgi:hypothetical protein